MTASPAHRPEPWVAAEHDAAEHRDRDAQQRDDRAVTRDHSGEARDGTAVARDLVSGHRDVTAGLRDAAAELRDATAYAQFGGHRLPAEAVARWHAPAPEGEFTYVELAFDSITYDPRTPAHSSARQARGLTLR